MSLVDTTFGPIPGPLLNQWGQTVTYIKANTDPTYNPNTGEVSGSDTCIPLKALISPVTSRESEGLYRSSDVKFIFGTAELGTYFPSERDSLQYQQDGATRRAKIVNITTYRGEGPIFHTVIARPQ